MSVFVCKPNGKKMKAVKVKIVIITVAQAKFLYYFLGKIAQAKL